MSVFNATAILAVIQIVALNYSIYGSGGHAFTEVLLTAVFAVNSLSILENSIGQWASGSAVPDSLCKQLQKSTLAKATGLDVLATLKMFNIVWLALLLLLTLLSCLTAPHLLSVEVLFRLLLVVLLAIKLPLQKSLRNATSLFKHWDLSEFSAGHIGLYKRFVLVLSCFVHLPRLSAELEHVLHSPPAAISTASLESALLLSSASNAAPSLATTSTTAAAAADGSDAAARVVRGSSAVTAPQSFAYSPTLCALVLFAVVEAAALTAVLATPLLLALLESTHPFEITYASGSAGRYRIFAPLHCALQLLGAYLQLTTLYFAGAYLQSSRTVALELRRVSATGHCSDNSSKGSADAAVRKCGVFASVLGAARRHLLSQVYAILDCDARTLCVDPLDSAGAADADAFASGALPTPAPGSNSSNTGKGAKQQAPRGTTQRSASSSSGGALAETQPHHSSGGVDAHPQSYLLNLCCLVVLGVAALQLLAAISGCADQRGAQAQVLVASTALVLVLDLLSPGVVAALCTH